MNRQVRERMTALGVDNVALAPILMAWSWDPRSGRNPDEWWDGDVYDFVGTDVYDRGRGVATDYWFMLREWAAEEGVDVAVGEWGIRGTGEEVDQWHQAAADSATDGRGARVVALSAYDSSSYDGWRLQGSQLSTFRGLVDDPDSGHA